MREKHRHRYLFAQSARIQGFCRAKGKAYQKVHDECQYERSDAGQFEGAAETAWMVLHLDICGSFLVFVDHGRQSSFLVWRRDGLVVFLFSLFLFAVWMCLETVFVCRVLQRFDRGHVAWRVIFGVDRPRDAPVEVLGLDETDDRGDDQTSHYGGQVAGEGGVLGTGGRDADLAEMNLCFDEPGRKTGC